MGTLEAADLSCCSTIACGYSSPSQHTCGNARCFATSSHTHNRSAKRSPYPWSDSSISLGRRKSAISRKWSRLKPTSSAWTVVKDHYPRRVVDLAQLCRVRSVRKLDRFYDVE